MLPFEADGGHEGEAGAARVGNLNATIVAPGVVVAPEILVHPGSGEERSGAEDEVALEEERVVEVVGYTCLNGGSKSETKVEAAGVASADPPK